VYQDLKPIHVERLDAFNQPFFNEFLQNQVSFKTSDIILPPRDRIIHLVHNAAYFLNSNLVYFNHDAFLVRLNETLELGYENIPNAWKVNILVVIALGKLTTGHGSRTSGPSGLKEYLQAECSLPSAIAMCLDPKLSAETLCALAFYAQNIGAYQLAYIHVCLHTMV
jgi:hypothetical protein